MMYVPIGCNSVLIILRDLKHPASLGEIARKVANRYQNLDQQVILSSIEFLLQVGLRRGLIIEMGERYTIAANVANSLVYDVEAAPPHLVTTMLECGMSLEDMTPRIRPFQNDNAAARRNDVRYDNLYIDDFDIDAMLTLNNSNNSNNNNTRATQSNTNGDTAASSENQRQADNQERAQRRRTRNEQRQTSGRILRRYYNLFN